MSKLVYDAVITQLRGEAQEALAMIQHLLETPPLQGNETHVRVIKEYALSLVEAEGAMVTMQQYFGATYAPAPPPRVDTGPPKVITPDMSPTMREAAAAQKVKASAKKRKTTTKKKES